MSRLIVTNTYIRKRSTLRSERIGNNLDDMLRTIGQMPGVGSVLLPASVADEFGPNVLNAVVSPCEIIYEYDDSEDTVYVYDLLYRPNVQ